jgi:hypothetical protein
MDLRIEIVMLYTEKFTMFGRSGHELQQFENFVFRFDNVWNFCFMKFSVPNLSMKISILESICAEYEDEKSITLTRIGECTNYI